MQVHYERWLSCSRTQHAQHAQQQQAAAGPAGRGVARVPSFDGIDSPRAALLSRQHLPGSHSPARAYSEGAASLASLDSAASLASEAYREGEAGEAGPGQGPSHTTHEFLAVEVGPGGRAAGRPAGQGSRGGEATGDGSGGAGAAAAFEAQPAGPDQSAAAAGEEEAALLPAAGSAEAPPGLALPLRLPELPLRSQQRQLQAPGVAAGAGEGGADSLGPWRPLQYSQQHIWRRVDWARYYFLR